MTDHQLSVQLYTARAALADDFDATLGLLAEYGFTVVEPFQLLAFADQLRLGLPRHGLSAPTAHVNLLEGDQGAIFATARELGVHLVIEPHVPVDRWQDVDAIQAVADELNAAGERAAGYGLRVGYHNHHHELESVIDGRHGLEVLADRLSPDVLLEVDTYWAQVGGADVPALLRRLGGRVVALHVKDGDGSLDDSKQVAVGSGAMPIWDHISGAPEALRVVELDDCEGDILAAVRKSREYLLAGPSALRSSPPGAEHQG